MAIWDIRHWCELLGHDFFIVNDSNVKQSELDVIEIEPDILHIHADSHFGLAEKGIAPTSIIQSHWPALFELGQERMAKHVLAGSALIGCSSTSIVQRLIALGFDTNRLVHLPFGVRAELVRFAPRPRWFARAICAATINRRKRQHLLSNIQSVDFAGPFRRANGELRSSETIVHNHPRYLGEWTHNELRAQLTDYSSYVLLSEYEAGVGVAYEAMAAGLGLVLSDKAAAHMDCALPFIDVVPEADIHNEAVLAAVISRNQLKAVSMRADIREHAVRSRNWSRLVPEYLTSLMIR